MQVLYSILHWWTSLVAILFSGSTLLAFTKSSFVSTREKGAFVFITLIFVGAALGAFYLKKQDRLESAGLLLGILWLLVILFIIWAIAKARWN